MAVSCFAASSREEFAGSGRYGCVEIALGGGFVGRGHCHQVGRGGGIGSHGDQVRLFGNQLAIEGEIDARERGPCVFRLHNQHLADLGAFEPEVGMAERDGVNILHLLRKLVDHVLRRLFVLLRLQIAAESGVGGDHNQIGANSHGAIWRWRLSRHRSAR